MLHDSDRFASEAHNPFNIAGYVNSGFIDEVINACARRTGQLPKDWSRAYWLLKLKAYAR